MSGGEVMSSSLSLFGWLVVVPVLWPEGEVLRVGCEGGSGWVALGAVSWKQESGVPTETLITVPAGLKSSSFTITMLRSQSELLALEPEIVLNDLSPND